jgi:hypothetical protein
MLVLLLGFFILLFKWLHFPNTLLVFATGLAQSTKSRNVTTLHYPSPSNGQHSMLTNTLREHTRQISFAFFTVSGCTVCSWALHMVL